MTQAAVPTRISLHIPPQTSPRLDGPQSEIRGLQELRITERPQTMMAIAGVVCVSKRLTRPRWQQTPDGPMAPRTLLSLRAQARLQETW